MIRFLKKIFTKKKDARTSIKTEKDKEISYDKEPDFDSLIAPNRWHRKPYLNQEEGTVGSLVGNGLSNFQKDKKWGLIDYNGDYKINPHAGNPIIWKNLIPFKGDDKKIGIKNKNGKIIFPPKADRIKSIAPRFVALTISSKTILINADGAVLKTQYEIRFLEDHKFSEGAIGVEVWLENGETGGGYIDENGKSLTQFKYKYPRPFSNGLAFVTEKDYQTRYLINKKEEIVFRCPENWTRIWPFDGKISRIDVLNKGFGFIDKNFKIVIEPKFKGRYRNGLIHTNQNGKMGVLNLKEEIVVPFKFDGFIRQLNEHLFIVEKYFFKRKRYSKFSLYNTLSKQLELDFIYDNLAKASDSLLLAKKGDFYGFIDFSGNEVTKFILQRLNTIFENKSWVKIKDKWGVIELNTQSIRNQTNKVEELIEVAKSKVTEDLGNFLNKGATDEELIKLEEVSGFNLPISLKKLLRYANGEGDNKLAMLGLFFSSIDRIISDINQFRKWNNCFPESIFQDNMVKPNLYNPNRIPFATDESGQYLCIDYDPDSNGHYGQIIYLPCAEPEPISVIATNFDEFLQFIINSLQEDRLIFRDSREVDWEEDDWEYWRTEENADLRKIDELYFEKRWRDDWTDIAQEYNEKRDKHT